MERGRRNIQKKNNTLVSDDESDEDIIPSKKKPKNQGVIPEPPPVDDYSSFMSTKKAATSLANRKKRVVISRGNSKQSSSKLAEKLLSNTRAAKLTGADKLRQRLKESREKVLKSHKAIESAESEIDEPESDGDIVTERSKLHDRIAASEQMGADKSDNDESDAFLSQSLKSPSNKTPGTRQMESNHEVGKFVKSPLIKLTERSTPISNGDDVNNNEVDGENCHLSDIVEEFPQTPSMLDMAPARKTGFTVSPLKEIVLTPCNSIHKEKSTPCNSIHKDKRTPRSNLKRQDISRNLFASPLKGKRSPISKTDESKSFFYSKCVRSLIVNP